MGMLARPESATIPTVVTAHLSQAYLLLECHMSDLPLFRITSDQTKLCQDFDGGNASCFLIECVAMAIFGQTSMATMFTLDVKSSVGLSRACSHDEAIPVFLEEEPRFV